MSTTDQEFQQARDIIACLMNKGIKLLALDFDKTIVTVHTLGHWRGGSPQLAEHVRPCFKALMKAALELKLQVCVVTYSMQPDLIKDVLKLVLPRSEVNKIMIRANSKDWAGSGAEQSLLNLGKQQHLAWCVTELYDQKHIIIQPHEILLVDDDSENVALAQEFGHQAYEVSENVTLDNLRQFTQKLHVQKHLPVVS